MKITETSEKERNGTHFHLSKFDSLCRLYEDQSNEDQLDAEPDIT